MSIFFILQGLKSIDSAGLTVIIWLSTRRLQIFSRHSGLQPMRQWRLNANRFLKPQQLRTVHSSSAIPCDWCTFQNMKNAWNFQIIGAIITNLVSDESDYVLFNSSHQTIRLIYIQHKLSPKNLFLTKFGDFFHEKKSYIWNLLYRTLFILDFMFFIWNWSMKVEIRII